MSAIATTQLMNYKSMKKPKTGAHTARVLECKVCRDAGNEYIGHRIRNKEGIVVCPTLLTQQCRYCKQNGHTPKYCPVLESKKKEKEKEDEATDSETNSISCPIAPESNVVISKEWVSIVVNATPISPLPRQEDIDIKPTLEPKSKLKPKPKLWSQYESDEEYED